MYRLVNEVDEFENDDAGTSNSISVTSFRSAGESEPLILSNTRTSTSSSSVGKPKTNEKRLIDMNTVIANIERQQQEDERLR